MKHLALIALLATGCRAPPDIVTTRGVQIFFKEPGITWTKSQANAQDDWLVDNLAALRGHGYDRFDVNMAMNLVYVYVYTGPIPCGSSSPSGFCNGFQDHNVLYVRGMDCVYSSAYSHEIMHWLQERIRKMNDYDHVEADVW